MILSNDTAGLKDKNSNMAYRRALCTALSALFLLINTGSVRSAEGVRPVAAVRTETPSVIDGRLVWLSRRKQVSL